MDRTASVSEKNEAASSYIELEDYLKRSDGRCRLFRPWMRSGTGMRQSRTQTESDEESWLHGLFVLLRAEERRRSRRKNCSLPQQAVASLQEKNPRGGVRRAVCRRADFPDYRMAVPDASQMQVIRFGQLEENAEELRGITKGLISVLQTHFCRWRRL